MPFNKVGRQKTRKTLRDLIRRPTATANHPRELVIVTDNSITTAPQVPLYNLPFGSVICVFCEFDGDADLLHKLQLSGVQGFETGYRRAGIPNPNPEPLVYTWRLDQADVEGAVGPEICSGDFESGLGLVENPLASKQEGAFGFRAMSLYKRYLVI